MKDIFNKIIWSLPSFVHTVILKFAGVRLVKQTDDKMYWVDSATYLMIMSKDKQLIRN